MIYGQHAVRPSQLGGFARPKITARIMPPAIRSIGPRAPQPPCRGFGIGLRPPAAAPLIARITGISHRELFAEKAGSPMRTAEKCTNIW